MVTSSQLGNLVVTYTLYLMKRTGRNSSQRFINGSNSAKERPGESKKKKKEQKIFDRPVFRSDRSINLEEEENLLSLDREPQLGKICERGERCVPF